MQIGIIDYLLRGRDESCIYLAGEVGFDCVELSADSIGDPSRLLFCLEASGRLGKLAETAGVRISSVFATHYCRENLLCTASEPREQALLRLRTLFDAAAANEIPTIVLPLVGASDVRGPSELMVLQQVLEIAANWAAASKIQLALKSQLPVEQLAALLERYDARSIGVCCDPANALALDIDPVEQIKRLGDRIAHVHLKDRNAQGQWCGLGSGVLPMNAVANALVHEAGFLGPMAIEAPSGKSPIESARANLSACRRLLLVDRGSEASQAA